MNIEQIKTKLKDVMEERYRILEYKDFFIIQKNNWYYEYSYWLRKTKVDNWITIDKEELPLNAVKKDGSFAFYKYENFEESKYKTKEEALKAIEDFKKYPIYHKV